MNILVTGGAGFIGSHLIDLLVKDRQNKIIVLDNFYRGNLQNIEQHIKNKRIMLIKGDIIKYNEIKKIGKKISKADIIYHLAAQSNVVGSFFNPDYAFSTNIKGTYNVLKYASEIKADRLIFSSSREVYGNPEYLPVDEKHALNPINMYGATKSSGEMMCRFFQNSRDLKITILRIANVYGPRDKDRVIPIFLENAKKNKDLQLFGGKQVLDFIWVGDVINGIDQISKNDKYIGETVNIGTGIGTSIEELAKMIIRLTNSKSRIIKKPSRSFDVDKFIARSDKIKLKTIKLEDGLKEMIKGKA